MKDITGREYIYGIAQDKNGAPYLFNIGELVRCKDCRWYKYDSYCSKTEDREIDADNFCSYGERRPE